MQIRNANDRDGQRCSEIYAPFVTDSWISFETKAPDHAEMAKRIAKYSANHAWLVAEIDEVVAGYAYACEHRSREAYKPSVDIAVYVDPRYTRQGIGRALYGCLLQSLKSKNFHSAFAGIALPNNPSISLHEQMGFSPIGVYKEVGWKMDGWRDVGWWQRLL